MSSATKVVKITPWYLFGGAALYGATSYAVYYYVSAHDLPTASSQPLEASDPAASAFDVKAFAEKYDKAVGSEEWGMWTHHLRKWVLNHATGDVLEISAGTGRNLPHYSMRAISSLTLCDLSLPMLEVCEEKYYEELKLGQQHPAVAVKFCLSDAHCMTADAGDPGRAAAKQVHTLPEMRHNRRKQEQLQELQQRAASGSGAAGGASSSGSENGDEDNGPGIFSKMFGWGAKPSGQAAVPASKAPVSPPAAAAHASPQSPTTHTRSPEGATLSSSSWTKPWTWFRSAKGSEPCCCCCSDAGYAGRCRRGVTDAGLPLSRFPTASFDTVVDAFGLCSHEDPVQVLREASRVCRPDGKILLLEHGRGHYNMLNSYLDNKAEGHYHDWGCWWNRDINDIIKKAGLRVEKISRWHFGTTYIVIARPALVQ